MPLSIALAIIAIVAAIAIGSRQRAAGSRGRFVATAAGIWVALIVLALITFALATLIFGP